MLQLGIYGMLQGEQFSHGFCLFLIYFPSGAPASKSQDLKQMEGFSVSQNPDISPERLNSRRQTSALCIEDMMTNNALAPPQMACLHPPQCSAALEPLRWPQCHPLLSRSAQHWWQSAHLYTLSSQAQGAESRTGAASLLVQELGMSQHLHKQPWTRGASFMATVMRAEWTGQLHQLSNVPHRQPQGCIQGRIQG